MRKGPFPKGFSRFGLAVLAGVAGLVAGCDDSASPDERADEVPIEVIAVRTRAAGADFIEWVGHTVCGGLSCSPYPTCPEADAGAPADAAEAPGDAAHDAAPPDLAVPDGAPLIPPDAAPLVPPDAALVVGDAAPIVSDAAVVSADAAVAPPDLGVAMQPQFAAGPDGGVCVLPDVGFGYDPGESTSLDEASYCACSQGYSLEANGLVITFPGRALYEVNEVRGVELANGIVVGTGIPGPMPAVSATYEGEPLSGLIRVVEIHERKVRAGEEDYVVTFSGAFELASSRVRFERGLFRPLETRQP
jgi:hypothetical protein